MTGWLRAKDKMPDPNDTIIVPMDEGVYRTGQWEATDSTTNWGFIVSEEKSVGGYVARATYMQLDKWLPYDKEKHD